MIQYEATEVIWRSRDRWTVVAHLGPLPGDSMALRENSAFNQPVGTLPPHLHLQQRKNISLKAYIANSTFLKTFYVSYNKHLGEKKNVKNSTAFDRGYTSVKYESHCQRIVLNDHTVYSPSSTIIILVSGYYACYNVHEWFLDQLVSKLKYIYWIDCGYTGTHMSIILWNHYFFLRYLIRYCTHRVHMSILK